MRHLGNDADRLHLLLMPISTDIKTEVPHLRKLEKVTENVLEWGTEKPSGISENDANIFKLLDLVHKYETIANGEFRDRFIDGFLDISAANFKGDRHFGADCFDKRPYFACKTVSEKGIIDRLHTEKSHDASEKPLQASQNHLSRKESSQSNLRNRKGKSDATQHEKLQESDLLDNPKPMLRDPIYQFGTIVPHELRRAQSQFSKALPIIIELCQLKQEIESLCSKIVT